MIKAVLAGAAALALMTGAANAATVQFYSFGNGAPSMSLISNFSGDTVNSAPTTGALGSTFSGTGVVLYSTSAAGAEPAIASGVYGTGNYLSIEAGKSETLTFGAGVTKVGIYVGSLDTYNDLDFLFSGGATSIDYSGSQLGAVSGADDGAQTLANTNGEFVFTFSQPVTSLTLGSSSNSFEIASISAAVPEPATWAMMLVGLGSVGALLRNRRKPVAAALVA